MRTHRYPSDVTDAQWALIEPHIPVYPGGRPRKTDVRDVVDAVLYVLRTGCQWRYPPADFPPKAPGWGNFAGGGQKGTPARTHNRPRRKAPTAGNPHPPRTPPTAHSTPDARTSA